MDSKSNIKCLFMKKDERGIKEEVAATKYKSIIFFIMALIVVITYAFLYNSFFHNATLDYENDISTKRITNSSNEIKRFVETDFENKILELNNIKIMIMNESIENFNHYVNELHTYSSFDKIGVIYDNEINFTNGTIDYQTNVTMNGIEISTQISNDKDYLYFILPFYTDEMSGICGAIKINSLSSNLQTDIYNNTASILITYTDGNAIASYYNNNIDYNNDNVIDVFNDKFTNFDETVFKKYLVDRQTHTFEVSAGEEYMLYVSSLCSPSAHDLEKLGLELIMIVPKSELIYQLSGISTISFFSIYITLFISVVIVTIMDFMLARLSIKKKIMIAYDPKTNILRYGQFKHDANAILKRTKEECAICYANIVNFKMINQLYGTHYADKLLFDISYEMDNFFDKYGVVGYCGADNFIILIRSNDIEEINSIFECFRNKLKGFEDNFLSTIHLSIGIKKTLYQVNYNIEDDILRAKFAEGVSNTDKEFKITYFNEKMYELENENAELKTLAANALKNKEFEVYFQLKRNIIQDNWAGAEALVRWRRNGHLISPARFIPLFEENGFINKLDFYVFEQVCIKLREALDKKLAVLPVSINLSKRHFTELEFIDEFEKIVKKYNIPHELIEFEITEGLIIDNINLFKDFISYIHKHGYVCSMDDFGSGYSSFNVIRELDFDIIKLDGKFFKGEDNFGEESKLIVSSIIDLCHRLNKKVVAEGVEYIEQVEFLKLHHCDIVQGYYFSKPATWSDCLENINNK